MTEQSAIKFSQRSKPPARMRQNRLRRLSAPQELFVEGLVADEVVHIVELSDEKIGYVVTTGGDQIVEFHIEDPELSRASQALDAAVRSLGMRNLLAQTFDPLATFLGLACGAPAVTQGLLYRVIADPGFEPRSDVIAAPGTSGDLAELAALSDDFFDDAQEIGAYLAADGLMVYRDADGNPIGAGVLKHVISGIDGVDIGMVVPPIQAPRLRRPYRSAPQGSLSDPRLAADLRMRDRQRRLAAHPPAGRLRVDASIGGVRHRPCGLNAALPNS